MPITYIRRPIVVSGGNTFKFNSVGLPTIYEVERRDFTWNQVNNSGGFVQAQFNSVNLTTSFALGDEIYVKALAGSPYDGFGTVTAVNFSGGNTLVTTSIVYVNTSTSGFINNETLRSGYYLQIRFYNASNVLLTEAIFETSPTAKGRMLFDISEFAKALLSPDFLNVAPDFSVTEDTLSSKEIYIATREVWIGSQENESADSSNTIVAVLGAQQLPLLNGSNYGVTTTRFVSVQGGGVNARFLTNRSNLTIWRNWPFTFAALLNNGTGDGIVVNVEGVQSASSQSSSPYSGDQNEMLRANIGGINWNSLLNDTSAYLRFLGPDLEIGIVSDIKEACDNAVLLLFRNSLGGDAWAMFEGGQDYEYREDNGTKVKRMVLTAENLRADQWEELNDIITYGAELKENIVEILSTTNKTKTRAYQQVYRVAQDGTLTGVIVIPTVNTANTRHLKESFEIEIEYPEHFLP